VRVGLGQCTAGWAISKVWENVDFFVAMHSVRDNFRRLDGRGRVGGLRSGHSVG